jgi:REP element-mobilizing transposase RayT
MSRKPRINYPEQIVHVTSHANWDVPLFITENDRETFLKLLEEVIVKYDWDFYAYCLMDNHVHLLLRLKEVNLSAGMRELKGKYSRRFNRCHNKRGKLFRARFDDESVESEAHFLGACRYIELNPVEAKIVRHPSVWKWSSYRAMVGLDSVPSFLNAEEVLSNFGVDIEAARQEYERFVTIKIRLS